MEKTLSEILKRIEKRTINVQNDPSSDEEELFSYLTKVKQPDPVCHSSLENQNIAYVDEEETVENDKHNLVLEGRHNEVLIKTENDKVHLVEKTVNSQNESSAVVEQNVENNAHFDSELPSEIKISHEEEKCVGDIEEILDEPLPEKEETRIQNNKDNEAIERKQCGESDKYYLINEKDWLSLCARLHNAENLENGDRKTEADEKDSSEKIVLQPSVSSLEEKKSPNTVGKSLFSAFKQYNSPSKTLLKESQSNEATCNSSPQKVSAHKSPRAANMDQGYNSEGQTMSLDEDEQNDNKFSITSENQASPKVEIVYIRLEDGHIKYDTSKSPRLPTKYKGENNLNTVNKLDFSQQNTVHSNENNNAQLASASLAKNSDYECIDLLNDTDTVDSNFDDSNAEFVNTANTHDTTKHGMQLRFVRINNKLTRVYERVKHNVIDEVLDASFAYDHNKNEEDLEFSRVPGKEDSGDVVDGNAGNKDSFNFDDSQLIAFPLNAVDPENINIDDSMSMLTPSKLDILNSSSKLDPLTPSKLEFLSQIESCNWTSDKLEWSSPSKLDVNSPGKNIIIPTNEEDSNVKETNSVNVLSSQNQFSSDLSGEKKKTESPIILKVTKSGALVQCNSPLKVENTRNDSLINIEVNRNRSHIQNLWKTFKPGQRKRNKDRSFKEENQQCASESSHNDMAVNNGDSDNDDLTIYFSSPREKEYLKVKKSVDFKKKNLLVSKCAVSDFHSEKEGQTMLGTNSGEIIKNVKTCVKRSRRKKTAETNDSKTLDSSKKESKIKQSRNKTVTETEICSISSASKISDEHGKQNIEASQNTLNDASVSCSNNKSQVDDEKKQKTQLSNFHKDCNYKQVEFEDFETNFDKVKNKRKIGVVLKSEETVPKVISGNSPNLKQSQKRLPRKKEDEVPVKKRKVTSDKITEQNEHVEDVQMKSKDIVKKSCLKKGIKLKGSKRKEDASIERNETYIDGNINNVEQSSGHEGQNKINFLEHFFHIKLKEAGIGDSCERNSLNKSPSVTPPLKVGKISATYGKLSNKFENAPEERIFKSNDRNAGGKQEPAGKRSKKKKDTDTSVSLSKNEQVSKPDRTVQCRRKTFKQVDNDEKGNTRQVEEYENHSKVQEQSNSITQAVQKSPERTILCRRLKKQNVTSGINMMGIKNHEKDCKLFCEVGSKPNSQTKRAVKKRPKVLTTENELNTCTKQLYEDDDRSDVIGNVGVHNTKKSRVKAKEVKNSKLKKVETDSNRMENGKKNIVAKEGENNSQNYSSDIPKNNKVKKGRTKYSCNKKLSVNQTTSKIVQSKNIELETSKSIDELDSSIENENCDTKTKIVTSHDSDIACKEVIESNITDCKRQGTTVSILATFQPFQEEEVSPKDVKTADTSQKSKASGDSTRKSQKKPDKEKQNVFVVKRKDVSQDGDNKVCKRKRKVENDVSDLDTDNEKITTDVLFVGKESRAEKKKVKNTGRSCKVLSAKKLRSGKIRLNNTLEQGITPKSVKSPRKPYSRRKLKSGSKKQPKESWKDLLDEADFKFEFSDKANEQHRPINVRHVIRNILKTAQGKEKTGDKKIRHRERKEKSREHSKTSARNSQRLTSESDDAWLSDSGQNVSFPAFKFSSESDSEATKRASKVLANKNAPEILHKPYIDTVKSDEDSEPCGQKYIELHHSPIKVCDSQEIIKVRDSSVESAKDLNSTDSEEQQIDSKGSPDIKKSVDKLRAILDKVSGQEVVKKLKFVDRIGL